MSVSAILTLLFPFVHAYSKFHTTCTTPSSRTNYVSSPNTRGTLDILWSCLFTIIACTWTIQHLNVPEQPGVDPRELRGFQRLRWNLRGVRRSLKWMLVTTIAPEYILGKALADLYAAYRSKNMMWIYSQLDGVDWGLTHGFFTNMGGFVLDQSPNETPDGKRPFSGSDADALHTGQQDLEEDVANKSPDIAFGKLGVSRLIENGSHKFASVSIRENDSAEDAFVCSPEILPHGMSAKPAGRIPAYVPEMETVPLHHHLDQQQSPETSQFLPRRSFFRENLAPSSETHRRDHLRKDLPIVELAPNSITVPLLRQNKSAITLERILPSMATRRKAVVNKREARKPVLEMGATIWESPILRVPGALPYYNVPYHLFADEIFDLRQSGALPKLPKITSAEINDKSKGDTFVKLITSVQVLWFILQVVIRAIRQLSISQLEIAVTAFGICAIITYFLLLPKPKSVDVPITAKEFKGHIPIHQREFKTVRQRVVQKYIRSLFVLGDGLAGEVEIMGSHIPNDALNAGRELDVLHVGVSLGGIIFGAIHIAAWNLSFPTAIEQTLWRTASVMSTVMLPMMYLPLLVNEYVIRGRIPIVLIKIWDIFFGSLYVLARAFLLVEIFRTLFYLPEDAYVTTWASNFPHVS